jgi:hypothetical protein
MSTTLTLEELIKPEDAERSEVWLVERHNKTLIAYILEISDDGIALAKLTELGDRVMTKAELAKRNPFSLSVKLGPDLRRWEGKIRDLVLVGNTPESGCT